MLTQEMKSRRVFFAVIYEEFTDEEKWETKLSPFVPLIGVNRLRIQWHQEIGIRQGLTANFLQPWYNKPVEIEINGNSYIGAFGNFGFAEFLAEQKQKAMSAAKYLSQRYSQELKWLDKTSKDIYIGRIPEYIGTGAKWIKKQTEKISNAIIAPIANAGKKFLNMKVPSDLKKYLEKVTTINDKSFSPHVDGTIDKLKEFISYFNYGPFASPGKMRNIKHILVIENEKGDSGTGETYSYATFAGYIRNLEYTEEISHPFIYEYSVNFTGLPKLGAFIKDKFLEASAEKTNFEISVTPAGVLLKQGLGL